LARTLGAVVLDCADPEQLATFWSGLLDQPVARRSDGWWELAAAPGHPALAFQRVRRHRRPDRRGRPQQLHLDVAVDDLDTAERVALRLGATVLSDRHPGEGNPWRVYADPAGHPFCLCACAVTAEGRA
jgi:catechol 2,3-dioxygenase-like lactoylglutathione lyase family enzyme